MKSRQTHHLTFLGQSSFRVRAFSLVAFIAIISSAVFSEASAHSGYHYAGVSHTAPVAKYTTATMNFTALPSIKQCFLGCHVLAWTILAQSANFQNYVEAGLGFEPLKNADNTQVALWWTNQQKQVAQIVGYVPLGTPVKVEVTKPDVASSPYALVKWTWSAGFKQRKVSLGSWLTGPGIHPTKLEVYASSGTTHPPVSFQASNINIFPEDRATAFLYSDAPYVPVGTLNDYSVTYTGS